jgi:hypothetical protein
MPVLAAPIVKRLAVCLVGVGKADADEFRVF